MIEVSSDIKSVYMHSAHKVMLNLYHAPKYFILQENIFTKPVLNIFLTSTNYLILFETEPMNILN